MNGRKMLTRAVENWPPKVLSIALAIILFIFHRMSVLEDRFFSVPLNIELNGSLVPAGSYPRMIRVSLRGDASSILPILEDDIEAYVDMTKHTEPGSYRAPVQVRKQGTALGIDSLEINVDPMEINLELDQKISKYVPLNPIYQGYLEQGYELVSYTLSPNQVVVDGPQGLMSNISALPTEAIELGGRSEDFTLSVRVLNRDPLLVIRGDGVTEFRGIIASSVIMRSFDAVPIVLQGLSADLIVLSQDDFGAGSALEGADGRPDDDTLVIARGSIRLEGGQNRLENFVLPTRFLRLDASGIGEPGTYTLPVMVDVPPDFTLIRADPPDVTVEVYSAVDFWTLNGTGE
ncbi:hypothetical protein FACS1894142_4460 [Spirochaetia bacterium]|nr:hypothetical protein FACS1894142_4460 [Spirochaetia bacterium]